MTLPGSSHHTYHMSKPFRDILPKPSFEDGFSKAPTSGSGSNVSTTIPDSETIRREKLRLRMLEEQASSSKTKTGGVIIEQGSVISSARDKLRILGEHNYVNRQKLGVTAHIPELNLISLTDSEVKAISYQIRLDPNASADLKNRYGSGKIRGLITTNGALIKYLNSLDKD